MPQKGPSRIGNAADLFEVALRTGGLGAWETDLAAGTRTWTAGAVELFGLDVPIDEPIPFASRDHLREVMHPDDRPLLDRVHSLLAGQDEVEVAYRIIRPDLGQRQFSGRGRVIDRDADGRPVRVVHIVSDITERYEIETRNMMLMRELTHRTKNQLAIVLAVARRLGQSAEDLDAFQDAFTRRIAGMAAGVDALVEPVWGFVPLRALILSQVHEFTLASPDRLVLTGDDLELDNGAGEALGMALHELAANAWQHGALSGPQGRVEIAWHVEWGMNGRRALNIEWTERSGPPISRTGPPGFGSTVLTSMTEAALNATVDYELQETGAYWSMTAPIADPDTSNRHGLGIRLAPHPG